MNTTVHPSGPLPDVHGTARLGARVAQVLPRLQPGDVAVIDHPDLDRRSAQDLIDAGVGAVVNAAPLVSGRFPSVGPEMLAEAGIVLVERAVGTDRLRDASPVRVSRGTVLVGREEMAHGSTATLETVRRDMLKARTGLLAQLDTFTHNAAEFLRREQELVLNGVGLPELSTPMRGRPVVVVARAGDQEVALHQVDRFVREQHPVLVAVDKALDDLTEAGLSPHVAVVGAVEPAEMPGVEALRAVADLVVRVDRGAQPSMLSSLERLGARPLSCETAASAEDVALLLADAGQADLVVGVGVHADLAELLDRDRAGLASTYLTRLKLGRLLVDAATLPALYTGRVRPWHVAAVAVAGLLAVLSAVAVTPVGHAWLDSLQGAFS